MRFLDQQDWLEDLAIYVLVLCFCTCAIVISLSNFFSFFMSSQNVWLLVSLLCLICSRNFLAGIADNLVFFLACKERKGLADNKKTWG